MYATNTFYRSLTQLGRHFATRHQMWYIYHCYEDILLSNDLLWSCNNTMHNYASASCIYKVIVVLLTIFVRGLLIYKGFRWSREHFAWLTWITHLKHTNNLRPCRFAIMWKPKRLVTSKTERSLLYYEYLVIDYLLFLFFSNHGALLHIIVTSHNNQIVVYKRWVVS